MRRGGAGVVFKMAGGYRHGPTTQKVDFWLVGVGGGQRWLFQSVIMCLEPVLSSEVPDAQGVAAVA